jgi:hypothetical protein
MFRVGTYLQAYTTSQRPASSNLGVDGNTIFETSELWGVPQSNVIGEEKNKTEGSKQRKYQFEMF